MTALPTSLTLGSLTVETPVVLAPMAGITNRAFRRLCREYGNEGLGAGGASGATRWRRTGPVTGPPPAIRGGGAGRRAAFA